MARANLLLGLRSHRKRCVVTATAVGSTNFTSVAPGTALTATFQVTPPSYAPDANAIVHATAAMDSLTREAGVTVTVS